jgi:hypothetical protein
VATNAENLETQIQQIDALIIEITADPRPDYSVQGRSMSFGTYLTQLVDTKTKLVALRATMGGPFLIRSYGR